MILLSAIIGAVRWRRGWLCSILILGSLVSLSNAADLDGFQVWRTLGAATGFPIGAILLDVTREPDGSMVRIVFAGTGDFPCHRQTVMAWQKRITGKTPEDLAHPAKLCTVSQSNLYSLHSRMLIAATENDSEALVIQCGARRRVLGMPVNVENPDNPYSRLCRELLPLLGVNRCQIGP